MEKLGNFLWKIFSATMMFFFNIGVDSAKADTCSSESYELTVTYSCGTGTTGTPPSSDTACKYGSYTPKDNVDCKKTGYKFAGSWSERGSTRTVGKPYSVTATEPFTLTANWAPAVNVTYNCGDNTTGTPEVQSDTAYTGLQYTPQGIGTCKKAGYVFSGKWLDENNMRTAGQPYTVQATEPFTLTPLWAEETGVAKMSTYFTSSDVETNTRSHRICPAGKYLYSCGANVIGTNWLRGMSTGTYASHDYYSYNLDDSDTTNMSNLRKFFNGTETIGYYARNGSETTLQTVSPSEYKIELNKILSIFCTDNKGQISETVCKKCPNNGFIKESNVQTEDNYTSAKILWDTWNVHTIADCYMNEFTDSTGTYIYKSANIADSGTTGNKCYYLAGVAGNHLYYK